jgi:hypothetical protein
MRARPNIVLVHGAWADGSSWSAVIQHLQADGATTVEVATNHVAMVSHPDEVLQLIRTAAEAVPAAT